jgi:UDP-perosamine 4-acetyltransferase
MEKLIIIGSGGHAKVVGDVAKWTYEIVAYIGLPNETGSINGVQVIGGEDTLESIYQSGVTNAVIGVGDNMVREKLYMKLKSIGYNLINIISPNAYLSDMVVMGEGNVVVHGAIINAGTILGDNNIINTGATIDHDCIIGNHNHIAPGCNLAGKVKVGDETFVGIGSKIIPEIEIGSNVVLGAGSVVINNISDGQKVVGAPAKKIINI